MSWIRRSEGIAISKASDVLAVVYKINQKIHLTTDTILFTFFRTRGHLPVDGTYYKVLGRILN